MKKILCLLLSITSLCLFSSSFASPSNVKTYYPTDITITNVSYRFIDIHVPALRYSVRLYPHYVQHIVAYDPDPKRVILYDYNGNVFYDQLVSNHQELIVDNRLGKLMVQSH